MNGHPREVEMVVNFPKVRGMPCIVYPYSTPFEQIVRSGIGRPSRSSMMAIWFETCLPSSRKLMPRHLVRLFPALDAIEQVDHGLLGLALDDVIDERVSTQYLLRSEGGMVAAQEYDRVREPLRYLTMVSMAWRNVCVEQFMPNTSGCSFTAISTS